MTSLAATGRFSRVRLRGTLPKGWDLARESPAARGSMTLHDTFDLRICRGGRVVVSGDDHVLDGERAAVHVVDALDADTLPKKIRKLIGVRKVLPVATAHVEAAAFQLCNGEGKVIARVRYRLFRSDGQRPLSAVRVEALEGHAGHVRPWLRKLRDGGLEPVEEPVERWLLWSLWRERAPYFSKPIVALEGRMPVAEALVRFFSRLAGAVRLNLPGTLDQLDPEFLHDLRVAARRTRSMLSLAETVFDSGAIRPFRAGFREVQQRTNRARDLDVMLMDLELFRRILEAEGEEAHLEGLESQIRKERKAEQVRLRRFLTSRRFNGLLDSWESFLAEGWNASVGLPAGGARVSDRAAAWLMEALQRVERRYRRAAASGREADMHRLRIAFKRLRYLLEFGESLHAPGVYRKVHSELKATQDVLGRFNDLVVQERAILSMVGHVDGETGAVLDRLAAKLTARRRDMMADCLAVSEAYFSGSSWRRWKKLSGR